MMEDWDFQILELEIAEAEIAVKGGAGSGHHGHAGRPGQRGGSAPGGKSKHGMGRVPTGEDITTGTLNRMLVEGVSGLGLLTQGEQENNELWATASQEMRRDVKHNIITDLTARMGYPVPEGPITEEEGDAYNETYDGINDFVAQWAESSNDSDMRSLSIQRDAAAEFGVPLSKFQKTRLVEQEAKAKDLESYVDVAGKLQYDPSFRARWEQSHSLLPEQRQREILRAMHTATQEWFAQHGFKPSDTIRLRRGLKRGKEGLLGLKTGDVVKVRGNALESWSVGRTTAEFFAVSGMRPIQRGLVLEMDIPISAIIASARTGFGCLNEGEFVVLGTGGEARVIFITG